MRVEELRRTLQEEARELGGTEPLDGRARLRAVDARVQTGRLRRRSLRTALVGAVVVGGIAAFMLAPSAGTGNDEGLPLPSEPMVQAPPSLAGFHMPPKITSGGLTYSYTRGQQVSQNRQRLLVAVEASSARQMIGWSTTPGTPGRVVVSVDGETVNHDRAGRFEYGVLLAPGKTHLVVVRPEKPQDTFRIGLAIYGPETF